MRAVYLNWVWWYRNCRFEKPKGADAIFIFFSPNISYNIYYTSDGPDRPMIMALQIHLYFFYYIRYRSGGARSPRVCVCVKNIIYLHELIMMSNLAAMHVLYRRSIESYNTLSTRHTSDGWMGLRASFFYITTIYMLYAYTIYNCIYVCITRYVYVTVEFIPLMNQILYICFLSVRVFFSCV